MHEFQTDESKANYAEILETKLRKAEQNRSLLQQAEKQRLSKNEERREVVRQKREEHETELHRELKIKEEETQKEEKMR